MKQPQANMVGSGCFFVAYHAEVFVIDKKIRVYANSSIFNNNACGFRDLCIRIWRSACYTFQ